MRFSALTAVMLGSLAQTQAQLSRIVGANDNGKEPSVLQPAKVNALENDPVDWNDPAIRFGGVLTSFAVIEGTGCPAGTFTPQPIEAGTSTSTVVDFNNFDFNSTTSQDPVTCTISYDFEYTMPERGYGGLYVQLHTATQGFYEENDTEQGTNFNVNELLNIKAGPEEIADTTITMTFVNVNQSPDPLLKTGAMFQQTGPAGEKRVGSFRVDYSIYTSFGAGAMKVPHITAGFSLNDDA